MKYDKSFSIGIRSRLQKVLIKVSRERQKHRGKIIREALDNFDYSLIPTKPFGDKTVYDKEDRKRTITVRFEKDFVNEIDFIAEMKNKTRDEVINEALTIALVEKYN